MRNTDETGFTLGELMAVLGLLAILSAAVFPLVQNAMLNTELDGCRVRGRAVYMALDVANAERGPLGKALLPGGQFKNSTELFRYLIEQEHVYDLSYDSLACCGVPVCTNGKLQPENNMWTVVKEMRDDRDDAVPILFTRNLDARSFVWHGHDRRIGLDPEWQTPLGKRGGMMIRKGGAVFNARAKYLTNRTFFGDCKTDPGPVRYLTPTREVVTGE